MDPLTAFAIAILMMLLNGAVLGLVHRDLPEDLRPAADSWRIGTLLAAGGCFLLALQGLWSLSWVLAVANAIVVLGLTAYWRALRQVYGQPTPGWIWSGAPLAAAIVYYYTEHEPDLPLRIVLISLLWSALLACAVRTLLVDGASDTATSRRVLIGVFASIILFMSFRAVVFLRTDVDFATILSPDHWMNMVTPLVATILPVVGTTAFLQLLSDHIRRRWMLAASTDQLTGLPNRRTLTALGAQMLAQARENGTPLTVAVIDVDHFKRINDQFGHETGDEALRHLGAVLAKAVSATELAARQGGEEFVLLLPAVDLEGAVRRCDALRGMLARHPLDLADERLPLRISAGVAGFEAASDDSLDDVLRRADMALYRAKAEGRDRVVAATR
jgi:diguanylate cyclase (GGDEF)-like protein